MPLKEQIRIDKWLWAVRLFKTRTLAANECFKGRVLLNGNPVKPSHIVNVNEIIIVRKPPVIHTYKVKNILKNRVSAKVVKDYAEDLTSDEELNKLELAKININFQRDPGTGRPTKKDRRKIEKLKEF